MNGYDTDPLVQNDEATYHADRSSLSQSGAKLLLDCPARFRYDMAHPVTKAAYDIGHAVHEMILGTGQGVHVVDAADWRTNAAKDAAKAAREAGRVPLLRKDFREARRMASAVRNHDIAGPLLAREGVSERSMYAEDPQTGVILRGRFDRLTTHPADGRPVFVDVKTTPKGGSNPATFARKVEEFGYYVQAPWYVDLANAAGVIDDPDALFVFVTVEKEPPYLVGVHTLAESWIDAGRERARHAIDLYADCLARDHWPAYADRITELHRPGWAA
ncbi:PD-(D/E)XK nuclease-like domain-containing protein [Luteipulveratus halotolerans]|uniref:Putative exodeoxyribonuclease 8 PDDEXK-like domain-containing protein n=1 Tax=Luteipulveratus halotolerans TaxID=1631356 RepID=A0A0L6CK16_9MICO|nr:PD-(D/E)XK nuclease-like domain-containing protein [Luteipulveratus halotolerans]KNX38074.1 hypothetical protein VV01_14460 [Luteipulveratus halotolerans]